MSSTDHPAPRRLSDQDRQAVLEQLAVGLAEGRLDRDEYDERLGLALQARTSDQLVPVTVDLPLTPAARRAQIEERRRNDLQQWLTEWRYWAGAAVLMVGIWSVQSLVSGHARAFWPLAPLGIWAVVLLAVAVWPSPDASGGEHGGSPSGRRG